LLSVIVRIPDLTEEVRHVTFKEAASGLNEVLSEAPGWGEQRFDADVTVEADIYRQGTDVYFEGGIDGEMVCTCPRCLDEFVWPFHRDFQFLIVKATSDADAEDDEGLDHYTGDELDLGRLVREQSLLALDDSVLCSPDCRGLCAGCGANLNHEPCTCPRS